MGVLGHQRVVICCVMGLVLHAGVACDACAQTSQRDAARDFPSRPIRLIVPFSPGGGSDITARAIAQKLGERLGQQVIVDNRPGAAGNIGAELAARATPDGHTLLSITASITVNAALQSKLRYDLLKDFAPITQTTSLPYTLVVTPSLPAKSVKELIALANSKPAGLTYGSSGIGGLSHLSGALLAASAAANLLHVPYKGGAAALADVLAGQINMLFSTPLQAGPHLRSGKLRALAVTTKTRSKALPEVPTMVEAGVADYDVNQWNGLLVTGGTPAAVVARIHDEVLKVLHAPEFRERLSADGSEPVGSTPEALREHVRSEIAKWKQLGKKADVRLE